jgi:hypothetical protein
MTIALYLLSMLLAQQPAQAEFGSLSGQLRGPSGEVAAGVRIAAAPVTAGGLISQAPAEFSNIDRTDGEGRYRLENVRPGLYLLVAGSLTTLSYYPAGATPSEGKLVAVTAGQAVTNLDFAIGSASVPLITGTVRFDDNTPVTNAALRLGSLQLRFTRAGSDQQWSGTLHPQQPGALQFLGMNAPGTYSVTLDPLPLGYYLQSMTYGSTDVIRYPMVLTARLDNPILDVVLSKKRPAGTPSGVKVSGRVINQNPAEPKTSRQFTLLRLQDNFRQDTIVRPQDKTYVAIAELYSEEDGSFEIDGVPPGSYALAPNRTFNVRPNFQGTTFDVTGNDVRNLELKVGGPEYPITLTASKTTTIKGTVDTAGGTVPEFEFQFVPTRAGEETRSVKISSREFSTAVPEGSYRVRISGLPTGYAVESVIAGPMDLTEPFLVTAAGIADRFTGVRMKSDGITVKLSRSGNN